MALASSVYLRMPSLKVILTVTVLPSTFTSLTENTPSAPLSLTFSVVSGTPNESFSGNVNFAMNSDFTSSNEILSSDTPGCCFSIAAICSLIGLTFNAPVKSCFAPGFVGKSSSCSVSLPIKMSPSRLTFSSTMVG